MTLPLKTKKLSFTTLEFYDSVVVSTIKEDIVFDQEHVNELRQICSEHFGDKGYVYITNRKNNYNVNPVIYIDLIQTNTLKGIAVISQKMERLQTANFEKKFSPVPYELFQNREEAIAWAQSLVSAN
ncbi:hypothetical protein C8P64_1409 [Christiangramia gaetbulicola]|uniref:SpoIIAA-like protein n=2 Tax=Christiangramia gaetbulicola TaxID=703340 RepID=A0A2T6AGG4_9FLAO|nr:hypothetical protein C8P64_1409 [Christiangramia gaetbulicola]